MKIKSTKQHLCKKPLAAISAAILMLFSAFDSATANEPAQGDTPTTSSAAPTNDEKPKEKPEENLAKDPEQKAQEPRKPEDDPTTPWSKRLSFRAAYGMTMVAPPYSKAMNMKVALGYRATSWFESGFAYRKESASYEDVLKFAATGYSETRTYQLDEMILAPYVAFRLAPSFSLLASAGMSSTTSTLSSITTDAPAVPTLAPGYTREAAWCLAYNVALSYEYLLGSFGIGLELGYGSSSSNQEANLKGAYAAALLTLRPGGAQPKFEDKPQPAKSTPGEPSPHEPATTQPTPSEQRPAEPQAGEQP